MDIKDLLSLSVSQRASDLHLIPGLPPQLRIDGVLASIKNYSILTAEDTKNLIYSFLTEEQKHIFEKNLVGEMALYFANIGNFRASLFHQLHGKAAVFRVIPETAPTFS